MNHLFRICSACNQALPETTEFFRKRKYKNGTEYFYSVCKICSRKQTANYYAENRDTERAKARKAYWDNPEKERERSRNVMQRLRQDPEFRERENERSKNWYYQNPDKVKEYRAVRKSHYRALGKAFYYRHRDRILIRNRAVFPKKRFKSMFGQYRTTYMRNRRAAKMGAEGFHTEEDIYIQLARQDWRCYYCLKEFENDVYDVDHLMPLTKGGSNWPANIVCACPSCNRSKNDKAPWEWQDFWLNHILKDT